MPETPMLTDAELDAIEARAKAATPGPGEYGPGFYGWDMGVFPDEDAAFIAHARADVPALIDALRESRERERRLNAAQRDPTYDQLRAERDAALARAEFAEADWRMEKGVREVLVERVRVLEGYLEEASSMIATHPRTAAMLLRDALTKAAEERQ